MQHDNPNEYVEEVRSAIEVAKRCIVLHAVVAAGHGKPRKEIVDWLRRVDLWTSVSPMEASFLLAEVPTQQQLVNATWRAEALAPLLWALSVNLEMPQPTQFCDVLKIEKSLPMRIGAVAEWLAGARLRPTSELAEANESIYLIHWAVRDAWLNGRPVPNNYHPGIVQERHHAFNCLIGYCGQDWDDISTDT